MTGRLPTEANILEAVAWRLAGFSPEWVREVAGLVFEGSVSADSVIDESALHDLSGGLLLKGDRRGGWSLACALLAIEGRRRQEWSIFWPAGMVVLQAWQQACRGRHERAPDVLGELIAEFRKNQPDATARETFEHFGYIATRGIHPVLLDADREALFVARGGASVRIGFDAFRKRFKLCGRQPVASRLAA